MNGVPRVPEAWEYRRMKRCTRCGVEKPWADFSPVAYWPDGSVRRVSPGCKLCLARYVRPFVRDYRQRNREKIRAYQREWDRRRRKALKADRRAAPRIPAEPFKAWLRRQLESDDMEAVATRTGINERGLRRILSENENVQLDLVDRALLNSDTHLYDLYPDLGREEAAA